MEVDNDTPSSTQQIELSDVIQLAKRPTRPGDHWYIIEKNWFESCTSFITSGDESLKPGNIDNGCE